MTILTNCFVFRKMKAFHCKNKKICYKNLIAQSNSYKVLMGSRPSICIKFCVLARFDSLFYLTRCVYDMFPMLDKLFRKTFIWHIGFATGLLFLLLISCLFRFLSLFGYCEGYKIVCCAAYKLLLLSCNRSKTEL